MLKIILPVGIPGCGKSTWAKEEVRKSPEKTTRISRDDLRNMMSNYHHSDSNEKLVTSAKEFILRQALRAGRDVIIDETNINRRNFDDVCKIAKEMNINCMVMEKPFYVDLEEAIARDSKREGTARVGEEIVRKFWKKSGGAGHKHYKPRIEIINCQDTSSVIGIRPTFDATLTNAVICDLDGTISLFNSKRNDGSVDVRYPGAQVRSPYDASRCDEDSPNEAVIAVLEALVKQGYKVVFCSGREDCYREQTERFLKKHVSFTYELHMRKTHDSRKDSIIKKEIYDTHIAPNYNVLLVLDDRSAVVALWRQLGLPCFQVAEGDF